MDKHILKATAERFNVYDENVLRKTEEFLRTYQNKASIKTLNDQAKTVLCLDLALSTFGKGFDRELAISLSGLKKSSYQNSLNTLEKVLGLDKTLTVSDLCVQLGCTSIKDDAQEILKKYHYLDKKIKDLDHPQYVAAATYLACKVKKVPTDKSKFVSISRLRPAQWRELINEFESLGLDKKVAKGAVDLKEEEESVNEPEVYHSKKDNVEEVEEYEVWKKRILEEAYAALNNQE